MITRVRETDGGYRVTILTADGVVDERETDSLARAFAWQSAAQAAGAFPSIVQPEPEPTPVHEPEVRKTKGKAK